MRNFPKNTVAFIPRKTEYLDTTKPLIYAIYPQTQMDEEIESALVFEGVIEKDMEDRYLIEGTRFLTWRDALKCHLGLTLFLTKKEALDGLLANLIEQKEYWSVINVQEKEMEYTTSVLDKLKKMNPKDVRTYLEYPAKKANVHYSDKKLWEPMRYGIHYLYDKKPFIYECLVREEDNYRYLIDSAYPYGHKELLKVNAGIEYYETFEEALEHTFKALEKAVEYGNVHIQQRYTTLSDLDHQILLVEEELKKSV